MPWRAADAARADPLWEDLALLLETLEEKQVHLVRDVVPLFWSLCVLRRAFNHSNGFVVRWAVLRALELAPADEAEEFVTAALLPALNDAALYADVDVSNVASAWDATGGGEEPYLCDELAPPTECGRRLRAFLAVYLHGPRLARRAAGLVGALTDLSWSSVALLYVAHALAAAPVERCLDAASATGLCPAVDMPLALRRTLEEVTPSVGEFIVRQVQATTTAEDLEMVPFYAEFLGAAAAAHLTRDVTTVARRLCEDAVGFVLGPRASPAADHLVDRAVRAGGGRHFANSASHRLQQRCYQALLVLHTALPPEELELLCAATCESLLRCHPQPSVRYMQEWLVVCLCVRRPELLELVWTHLEKAGQERTGSISSFVAILTHLAQCGTGGEGDAAETFVRRCFCRILPWCMAQHFNTRVYSQVALQRLWTLANERRMAAILSEFAVVYDCVAQSLRHGNANKNSQLIQNDFYFTEFDPVQHFSLEVIFLSLPRLAGVEPDEWVPPGDATDPTAEEAAGSQVQRKATPWRQLLPEVLAAALVDRAPNLGGLCRTCEVLGAAQMVVPSLQVVADKQFQSLSVSAERWVHLTEVKPHQLPSYLQQMRSAGYTLVGVEQTSGSVPVAEYQFPVKTLLLLGNEKEGIPVELLQLLDVCLEIPQRGLVRSLNVHVAGALLVWEYCRQHR
ncbi:probable methyltransferase TARBP1 [Pollicipes pollicipes]|uniref:probable methyltransferase TARBP1 n=1 Tax=Pollicipes pollicipes TaxID=41117 RepID=UPI00188526D0|nr:probable methyltransferase TARBP1 [Pollicipes pollicipes]